ncbi:MAG: 4Fe-4S binding protein [Gammaproteobacteria bacterium]|nr:4Fe-4S binding protein [Gammaproteobacteria bacterium]
MKRKIIEIDEDLCNGCGQCSFACAGGAIKIINNKAKLISDSNCDGLGACIGHCPMGALKITERKADPFGKNIPKTQACNYLNQKHKSMANSILNNWPIQITLAPEITDCYNNTSGILIAADCTAFFCLNFHVDFVKGKTLLIGCPKLDGVSSYTIKLAAIFTKNNIKSISIVRMEVPCCKSLTHIVKAAIILSKTSITPNETIISVAS